MGGVDVVEAPKPASLSESPEPEPAVAAPGDVAEAEPPVAEGPPPSFDEVAESAFRAEARDRGEKVPAVSATAELAEDSDPKNLPPLDDLVKKIPAEVRDALEDLFRAKFIAVKRMPRSALK